DTLRQVVIGMVLGRRALFVKLAIELVPCRGKFAKVRHPLQINVVIGLLGCLQRQFRFFAPAVRFWAEVGNASGRLAEELRHVLRNPLRRCAVDGDVPLVAPALRRRLKDDQQQQSNRAHSAGNSLSASVSQRLTLPLSSACEPLMYQSEGCRDVAPQRLQPAPTESFWGIRSLKGHGFARAFRG